jgi:hypothetical protein
MKLRNTVEGSSSQYFLKTQAVTNSSRTSTQMCVVLFDKVEQSILLLSSFLFSNLENVFKLMSIFGMNLPVTLKSNPFIFNK